MNNTTWSKRKLMTTKFTKYGSSIFQFLFLKYRRLKDGIFYCLNIVPSIV